MTKPFPTSSTRRVQLGWVEGWDDASRLFLMRFSDQPPAEVLTEDHSDETPFVLQGSRSRRRLSAVRARSGQQAFKLKVFQRYGPRCPLSGVAVAEMLEAAHIMPDAEGGTGDPRNGLPLNAALHRAFDAYLFAINPDTYQVETRHQGPTLEELGITTPSIAELLRKPHRDALAWRYTAWRNAN